MVGGLHEVAGKLAGVDDTAVFWERHLHRFGKSAIFMKQNVYYSCPSVQNSIQQLDSFIQHIKAAITTFIDEINYQ